MFPPERETHSGGGGDLKGDDSKLSEGGGQGRERKGRTTEGQQRE